MKGIFSTSSEKETRELGARFVKQLDGGIPVLLTGDVGCGKTTFVRGIAQELGIHDPIQSPTFVILKTYPIRSHRHFEHLYHLDEYRLSSAEDIHGLDIIDHLYNTSILIFIENPKHIIPLLHRYISVSFTVDKLETRTIEIGRIT